MERKTYKSPQIEIIVLDNDISLALESNPPIGPTEARNEMSGPDNFNTTPLA